MSRRLLIPKEHGTWGELLFPLATALCLGRVEASAMALATATLSGYLASEGVQTLAGWRGPRARREHRTDALLSVAVFAGVALAGSLWVYFGSVREVRVAVWAVAGLTALSAVVAVAGGLRTAGGEVLAALALGAWSVPVAMIGGVSWRAALGIWLLWGVVFSGGTLAVRALIARQTRRGGRAPAAAGLALTALAVGALAVLVRGGHVPWVVLVGFLPAAILVAVVALAPIPARRLRWVGWSLVAASALLFASLVGVRA